jgi:aspartate racemase
MVDQVATAPCTDPAEIQPHKQQMKKPVLGVLGGMGGLASAEFVKTIYEFSGEVCEREQWAPVVVMYSDPDFPDRTEAFLRGETQPILTRLIDALERLDRMGASQFVICCMTIHYLLPQLPGALRERIISLPDVIFSAVESLKKKHLVISSTGTMKLELLQGHPRWQYARKYFVFPSETEQRRMHELIYRMKFNRKQHEAYSFVKSLLEGYQVDSFIAACSEIHLLAKQFAPSVSQPSSYGCIDPLSIIAWNVVEQNRYEA